MKFKEKIYFITLSIFLVFFNVGILLLAIYVHQTSVGSERTVAYSEEKVIVDSFEKDLEYFNEPRSIEEIVEVTEEFLDKIWFDRHLSLRYRIEAGVETVDSEIWKGALQSAQRVIEKYGEENLGPYSDFEWGMLNGKLSALRWVLGDEWDMLDT